MKDHHTLLVSEECNDARIWIDKARMNGKSWEEIDFACKGDLTGLQAFLKGKREDDFWTIFEDDWQYIVKNKRIVEELETGGFIGDPVLPVIASPNDPASCWMNYKAKISKKFNYLSVSSLEKSTKRIVTYLRNRTEQDDPTRGMVVGNVQSGKTANMAGVISMAADYGYNFFIVLTGTIDNLREQTRDRLIGDLNNKGSAINFQQIEKPTSNAKYGFPLSGLQLNSKTVRYITVCLKNPTRLRDLLNWLNKDEKNKANLKVLLIDDEADQAGINTKDVETDDQTTISRLIKNIVFGRDAKDKKRGPYESMNYIGYTATPYANFLNESGPTTLYPKDFISLLSLSPDYFGPAKFFGIPGESDELGIVNQIGDSDVKSLNGVIHAPYNVPDSLRESILWFAITVACFRYWDLKKPVSMLVHTSQNVAKHSDVSKMIQSFFMNETYHSLLSDLKAVYAKQTKMLSLEDFKAKMVGYDSVDKVNDYPSFETLKHELDYLFSSGLRNIMLNSDSDPEFGHEIHLCIDNCDKHDVDDDSIEMRIVYPKDDDPINDICPAFIVIGGATLSRGLTLKGLTTSFFLRNTTQADTLMQMGRWFGYRKGYELLQRLWLPAETHEKFVKLTRLDYDLRNELSSMDIKGLLPKDYGPRLDAFPDYKSLIITSKKKQQGAVVWQTTFYNKSAQTTWFFRDNNTIDSNYSKTLDFLNELGDIDDKRIGNLKNPFVQKETLMWFDVDFTKVINYLESVKIPNQAASFIDYAAFLKWYSSEFGKGNIGNWTVIAGGVKNKIHNDVVLDNGKTIHLENRTRIEKDGIAAKDYSRFIDLNTISQHQDRLMDIDCSGLSQKEIDDLKNSNLKFKDKRLIRASKKNPLLIVYIVDKDSGKGEEDKLNDSKNPYKRYSLESLHLNNHIVGYYLYIPYGTGDNQGFVAINPKYESEEKGE